MLNVTLVERDAARMEKEMAVRNAEAALKEKEDSLSAHQEAARV